MTFDERSMVVETTKWMDMETALTAITSTKKNTKRKRKKNRSPKRLW